MAEQREEATESKAEVEEPKVVPYEEFEAVKKAQAGSDRAYQEAQKKLEDLTSRFTELQKQSLTEKERQDLEAQERQKAIEAKEREVADASLRLTRMSLIAENGLTKEFERYAVGDTEEEIRESLNNLQTLVNKEAEKMVNEKLKSPGPPRSGNVSGQKTDFNAFIRQEAKRT